MKQLLAIFLASALLLLAVACGMKAEDGKVPGEGDPTEDTKHPANEDNTNNDPNNNMNNDTNGNKPDTPDDTPPNDNENNQNDTPITYRNAHELLAGIWAEHKEEDRFPVMGGDYDNVVENAPGAFDLSHADAAANIDSLYSFPPEELKSIDSAAGMVHGMNANIFTCGAFQIKEGGDLDACADRIKNHVLTKQFICGSPEKITILSLPGNYLISVYGTTDAVTSFVQKTQGLIRDTAVVAEQQLVR